MKTLFGLLNLLLCLELIVAPVAPNLSLLGPLAYADEGSCSTGFQWDSTLNRCLTSAETANVLNATSSCAADDVACYKENAEAALSTKEANGEVKKVVTDKGEFMKVAAVAVPMTLAAYTLWTKKKNVKCKAYSLYAMVGAGAALFAGDLIANMQHKKRLKQIDKDWNNIVKTNAIDETNTDTQKANATEAQSQAFEMLARSEDSMATAAKLKSNFYAVAMAAFAAVAAYSTYEMIDLAKAKLAYMTASDPSSKTALYAAYQAKYLKYTCNDAPSTNTVYTPRPSQKMWLYNLKNAPDFASFYLLSQSYSGTYSSPSVEDYEEIQSFMPKLKKDQEQNLLVTFKEAAITLATNINPLSQASADDAVPVASEGTGFIQGMVSKASAAAQKGIAVVKQIDLKLKTPATRAAISAVFAGWSGIMFAHARKQASASKERAKMLRKMKEEFNVASGAINMCTAADRTNTSKPECYCYTSEGQHNPDRVNSSICQKLFTGIDTSIGNYMTSSGSQMGCISSTGSFDSTCNCKNTNSCMKASAVNGITGLSTGTFSMLSSPLKTIDGISDGSIDPASVNGDATVSNAMRILDATKKLDKTKGLEDVKKAKDAAANGLEGSLIAGASGISPNLGNTSSAGALGNMTPAQAAAMLQKELDDAPSIGAFGSAGRASVAPLPGAGGETPQLEFGLTDAQYNTQKTQVAEVMKENFDYGQNDINEGSKTNIFEVLSNRYQRSGMRRLFDEKGTTKAEAPAASDIVK